MARKLNPNTARNTEVTDDGNTLTVTYHDTDVFVYDRDSKTVELNTGGYRTATTKTRMSQGFDLAGLPWQVIQEKKVWHIWNYQTGQQIYFDGTRHTLEV